MKLSVSGWPGGGSSTLALILCKLLSLKHVQGGGTFRYIYQNLNYSTSGSDRIDAHNLVEPHFGPIYDAFIDTLITSDEYDDLLIESDIAAFRVGKIANFFSIFLLTDKEVRRKRTETDKRAEDGDSLEDIDKSHADIYKELHGIDWFNESEIKEKHAFVLDNSEITIAEEIYKISSELLSQGYIKTGESARLLEESEEEEKRFWKEGKTYYIAYLEHMNLVMSPKEIIGEILKLFPEEVGKFPKELKEVLEKSQDK